MPIYPLPTKYASEHLDYTVDWQDVLEPGETVVAGRVGVTDGDVVLTGAALIDDTHATFWLSGGGLNTQSLLACLVRTSGGRDHEVLMRVSIAADDIGGTLDPTGQGTATGSAGTSGAGSVSGIAGSGSWLAFGAVSGAGTVAFGPVTGGGGGTGSAGLLGIGIVSPTSNSGAGNISTTSGVSGAGSVGSTPATGAGGATGSATIGGAGSVGATLGGGHALRFMFGQSNTVGAAGVSSMQAPTTRNYGSGTPSIVQGSVVSGSNNTSVFGWYDLAYLKASTDTTTDASQGGAALTGPYAERAIQGLPFGAQGGIGPLLGVAESVAAGNYHVGGASVRVQKVAVFGTPISDHDPYNGAAGGTQYKTQLRAMKRLMRPFVAGASAPCYGQSFVMVQGESEASTAQGNGTGASDPVIVNWPATFTRVQQYLTKKVAKPLPFILVQLMRVPNATDTGWDEATEAQRTNIRGVCRWYVSMASDGTIGTVTDQGAGGGRLDTCYFLDHPFTGAAQDSVHYNQDQYRAIGRGIVALEQAIFGSTAGNLSHVIQSIPPVALAGPTMGTVTTNTAQVTVQADEACTFYALAVTRGSAAPSVSTIASTGQTLALTEDGGTGATTSQSMTYTGLATGTDYDLYWMMVEGTYGHGSGVMGPVQFTSAGAAGVTGTGAASGSASGSGTGNVVNPGTSGSGSAAGEGSASGAGTVSGVTGGGSATGSATESGAGTVTSVPTTWDSNLTNGSKIVYSNGNRTVSRGTDTAITVHTRSVGNKSTGKYYYEARHDVDSVYSGFCTSAVGPSVTGQAGINKVQWNGGSVTYSNPDGLGGTLNNSMGGGPASTDIVQWCIDVGAQLFWVRRNNTGNWNNTAGADPATGTGGLSFRNLSGNIYAMCACVAATSGSITGRFASSDWTYAAPSGFGQINN